MKKTVATLAIIASATSAMALTRPGVGAPVQPKPKTICLSYFAERDHSLVASSCDMTARNEQYRVRLQANGCGEGQVALTVAGVNIRSCPTYTQL